MVTSNKLASAPDSAAHDVATVDAHDHDRAAAEADLRPDDCEESSCPASSESGSPDHLAYGTRRRRTGIRRRVRALVKPLISILTTQYVIVTVLAALTAVTVASEAAKFVNSKLDPIIAALKRL